MLSKKALIQLIFSCFKILVIGGMCAWVIMGWLDGFVSAEPYSLGGIMEGRKMSRWSWLLKGVSLFC